MSEDACFLTCEAERINSRETVMDLRRSATTRRLFREGSEEISRGAEDSNRVICQRKAAAVSSGVIRRFFSPSLRPGQSSSSSMLHASLCLCVCVCVCSVGQPGSSSLSREGEFDAKKMWPGHDSMARTARRAEIFQSTFLSPFSIGCCGAACGKTKPLGWNRVGSDRARQTQPSSE